MHARTGHSLGPEIENRILTGALEVARASVFLKCRFEGCVLQSADLTRCEFVECRFTGSNLASARLVDAEFRDAAFVDCKLTGIDWTAARRVDRVGFENCVLDNAAFLGMRLTRTAFRRSRLKDAVFADADLTDADLRECDLSGAHFARTRLVRADLRDAKGYSINPLENTITGLRVCLPEGLALLQAMGIDVQT